MFCRLEVGKKTNINSIIDLAKGNLSPEDSLKVLEEVNRNPEASRELDDVSNLMNFVAVEGESVFEEPEHSAAAKPWRWRELFGSRILASPITAVAAAFVLLVGFVLASSLTTSKYYDLTQMDGLEFESRVRGPGQEDFAIAYQHFSEGRYDESIRLLERYIRAFPHSDLVDYAHYSAGAIYLLASHKSFLSLFPSFDPERVMKGLDHLNVAASTASNVRVIDDSHWLRAKGFLMLHRIEDALSELRIVESLNGPKRDQASELIARIREVKNGV